MKLTETDFKLWGSIFCFFSLLHLDTCFVMICFEEHHNVKRKEFRLYFHLVLPMGKVYQNLLLRKSIVSTQINLLNAYLFMLIRICTEDLAWSPQDLKKDHGKSFVLM